MKALQKIKTGIDGLDEITEGGLPYGRPTLICGGPGCGKTLMAIEFIVKGIMMYNEPGVFMAFEEKADELAANVASLGFDLEKLQKEKKLRLDYVHIDQSEIEETGEYDLDGLFIRLEHAIDSIGAKRVVLDTIENLFAGLTNQGILRAELRRLFQWLKEKNVSAIITGEKGEGMLTRHGLEEYVSDCVIMLDHRIINQISTRRLRIVKYRGSIHGTNEYPFLIDQEGITVLPVTSLRLDKNVSSQRISTGVPALDEMFGGKGFFRGSSILVSGSAGTGKTSLAAFFADATCRRKEKCMFFAFEESPQQIMRNMRSIGLNLEELVNKRLLEFHSFRPGLYGLEMHLAKMYKLIKKFKPRAVILDPITNLVTVGLLTEVNAMLLRLIDHLQNEGITLMMTALNSGSTEHIDENVSSLVDAWLLVRDVEMDGERNRALYIMKSRGMKHSKEVREFIISSKGLDLVDVYRGAEGVLIGSARIAKEREEVLFRKGKVRKPSKASHRKIKK
jgi:circadian clock protein KaiC